MKSHELLANVKDYLPFVSAPAVSVNKAYGDSDVNGWKVAARAAVFFTTSYIALNTITSVCGNGQSSIPAYAACYLPSLAPTISTLIGTMVVRAKEKALARSAANNANVSALFSTPANRPLMDKITVSKEAMSLFFEKHPDLYLKELVIKCCFDNYHKRHFADTIDPFVLYDRPDKKILDLISKHIKPVEQLDLAIHENKPYLMEYFINNNLIKGEDLTTQDKIKLWKRILQPLPFSKIGFIPMLERLGCKEAAEKEAAAAPRTESTAPKEPVGPVVMDPVCNSKV